MTIEETAQSETENSASGKLLNVEERAACEILAEGDSLNSRRAQGLLALNEGATYKEAGEEAGLTLGQVRYLLKKFRNDHMAIFPEIEPTQSQPDDPSPEPIVEEATQSQPDDASSQPIVTETADVHSAEMETARTKEQPVKKKKKVKKKKVKKEKAKMKAKKGKKAKKGDKKKKNVKKAKKTKKQDKKKKVGKKSKKKKGSKKSKKKK
jgi:hypothetical protein